jgi:hypothetical protein
MPNGVTQAISRTTFTALNDVNDVLPGNQPSLAGANIYAAQLGSRMWLDGNPGGVKSDTAIGTLYGGCFQYVQFYSGTASPAKGLPAYWAYDQATVSGNVYAAFQNYIVSVDYAAIRCGRFAGVVLNAVTKGQYGWIQTKGLATVQYGTITGTPVDGDLVYVNNAANNFLEAVDGASFATALLIKSVVGVAIGAPVSGTFGVVLLKGVADVV